MTGARHLVPRHRIRWDDRMGPCWAWARRELIRRRRSAVALALLIGLCGAVVLAAAAGARRTGSAFDRFVEASNSADVQLQYASDQRIDAEILARLRSHP